MSRFKYRILGQVGRGQFAQVFCGMHCETGTLVALKDLDRQRFPTHRFLRELHLLARLQHPNIVAFHTLDYSAIGRYLVTDYCEGGTLRDLMESQYSLTLNQCLKLISDILQGLKHAHECGVVHCDLKPENILLVPETSGWTAKIADLGVAQLIENIGGRHVSLGATGSPAYMAPERYYQHYSYTSDLYAVGILLFELVVGQRPFSGSPGELMIAHLNQAVVIPKSVPFPLHSIITTALQKLPQKRFDSAKEMIKAVNLAMEVLQATQPKACICLPEQTSEEISDQASTIAFRRSSSICQVPWESPIDRLTVDGRQIYATVNQASTHPVDAKDRLMTDATTTVWQLPNDAIIEQIHQCAKGYFVLTRSHHTPISTYTLLYRSIPLEFSQVAQINSYTVELGTWQAKHMLCTIDPLGNWLAIAVQHEQSAHSYDTSAEPGHVSTQFQILRLPGLKPLHTPVQWGRPEYLLTLDHRHGLAILPDTQSGEKTAEHNVWRLFNRRGKFFDYCRLPANCGPVARSITLPYQLLTIEAAAPTSALLINLKPLKVVRLALNFSPTFIVATYQGYVLADQSGQMLLVDYHGVKQCEWKLFDSSDQQLTAMAVSETDEILVATWSGQMASIDTLTMHQLLAAA